MTRNNQKWYDKPITKLILVAIALTWIFPIFGFLLSSFRPPEAIKRTSWWEALYTGEYWRELTLQNYSEVFFAENLDRSFYNSLAITIPSTIIPITIAAFAAYAFAFMDFKGKNFLFMMIQKTTKASLWLETLGRESQQSLKSCSRPLMRK